MSKIEVKLLVTIEEDSIDAIAEQIVKSLHRKLATIGIGTSERTPSKEASRHANYGGTPPEDESLLVDSKQACKLLKISERKLWQMWNSGLMPKPTKIGRVVRWSRQALIEWILAGCPPQ
ncbi:hypothetical protein HOV93_38680 [Planctomycetes bacterium FF15]|uniref:Helix-turn-helix domain-containing protein n=2 Tax=Bremerella alba TaxID=980252 RepID=A0A7V9A922_9BACT|nr:hypothetical protein [Bremerella alba]